MANQEYPKDFLWGASTAAYQVEGGLRTQWSEWEHANAERLATTSEQRLGWLPSWDAIKTDATDPDNYISGAGVEHYTRYKDDFKLLKQLNMNAFRFSIEWARLEPEEGKWDEKAVRHYKDYIAELKALGIEPILNIWHWTMPVWFAEKGAFEHASNIRYFERFVNKVATEFCEGLRYVIVLNEPNVYVYHGYLTREWPPQTHHIARGFRAYQHLTRAHNKAYAILKGIWPELQIGIAMSLTTIHPRKKVDFLSRIAAWFKSYSYNWWFLDRIRQQLDFVGVNFYQAEYVDRLGKARSPSVPVNDLGWYMEPEAIGETILNTWRRYKKPVLVTENGLADAEDKYRQWWLERTTQVLLRVIAEGVDLRGYLHWSLLDNFEWSYGWWPKFGLVAVDRGSMRRSIRPSARWFAKYIRAQQKGHE